MGDSNNRRFEVDSNAFSEPTASGSTLDLGITDTSELMGGELDAYLTDNPELITSAPSDVKPIDEDEEDEAPKPKAKGKSKKKEETEFADEDPGMLDSFLAEEAPEDEPSEAPKEKEDKPKPDAEKPKDESIFTGLSKDLYQLGVFTPDSEDEEDGPINTPEEFLAKFNNEKIKQANEMLNNFLGKFGEDYRKAFESIYFKGVSPKEYFATQDRIQSFRDLDIKNPENQKKVFSEYFRTMGLSEDKIQKRLQKAIDLDELEEDVVDYHEVLIQKEEKKIQELEAAKAQEEQRKQAEDIAYSKSIERIIADKLQKKEFDGIPVTQSDAAQLYEYLNVKKWKLPNGELLTDFDKDLLELKNPENHELRVKAALLQMKKYDLSKVKQKAISTKADELFSNTTIKDKHQKRNTGSSTNSTSFFS